MRKKSRMWAVGRKLLITACITYIVFGLISGLAFVDGNSMHPVMEDGNVVFYLRIDRNFAVGDVVVYDHAPGDLRVKRIVGIAGDVLDISEDGALLLNGQPSGIEVFYKTSAAEGGLAFPYTVSPDEVVLMGDKRDTSIDSRTTGPVKLAKLKGKVVFVVRKV